MGKGEREVFAGWLLLFERNFTRVVFVELK
jgi:hypothetical protein